MKHHVERVARRARLDANGVHRLRHTFCSHLAMNGAARAIQELAGHQDPTTTERVMHLGPAAIEGAIRLLDEAGIPFHRGNMVATGSQGNANVNQQNDLVGGVDGTRTRGLCRDRAAF